VNILLKNQLKIRNNMGQFPCRHSFGDIIKFKMRGVGIVEGMIVGVTINGSSSENRYADYKVHSLDGQTPKFYFKLVAEHHIIEE
jgi:hypothetical protein